jgi:2,3,4,5-tetrahydropyridine-2-carboxylate N-succinyltransferase
MSDLQSTIDAAWEARDGVNARTAGAVREAVEAALELLDSGKARVAEKTGDDWTVHQWLKKAVLLSFRLNPNAVMGADAGRSTAPFVNYRTGALAAFLDAALLKKAA